MFLEKDVFSIVIESTPLISIDFIVKDENRKVLLGKRVNRPAQGYWFVPGGRIVKDETLQDAFKRITNDELGIEYDISEGKFLGVYQHFYDDNVFTEDFSTHYVVLGFEIVMKSESNFGTIQHSNYKWFEIDELLTSDQVHQHPKDYFIQEKGIR
ncbi:GDP-mannose mannosyl hydrolase [Sulfurimonas sp.]|uniref:GDP-mannose mannosyl hydrolase n=1 Tax=Sulfurimonas sp. TaxID=2022749 RepID=UPI003D0B001E